MPLPSTERTFLGEDVYFDYNSNYERFHIEIAPAGASSNSIYLTVEQMDLVLMAVIEFHKKYEAETMQRTSLNFQSFASSDELEKTSG